MDEHSEKTPSGKPSPIPSWVSLGFVLGALFVWALPRKPFEKAPPPSAVEPSRPESPRPAPRLSTIEAVFAKWGGHAVWDGDLTEVALWDTKTMGFTDCYEVLRAGDTLFFRSIPQLTRPIMSRGVPENSPLQFTETESQRQAWLEDVRKENWRQFSDGVRQTLENAQNPVPKVEPVPLPPIKIKPDEPEPPR